MKKKSKIFAKNLWVVRENISSQISDSMWLFFNRHYSLLSSGSSQLYTLEALPFTYGQYVVIELADKWQNFFCITFNANRIFFFSCSVRKIELWLTCSVLYMFGQVGITLFLSVTISHRSQHSFWMSSPTTWPSEQRLYEFCASPQRSAFRLLGLQGLLLQ